MGGLAGDCGWREMGLGSGLSCLSGLEVGAGPGSLGWAPVTPCPSVLALRPLDVGLAQCQEFWHRGLLVSLGAHHESFICSSGCLSLYSALPVFQDLSRQEAHASSLGRPNS